MELFDEAFVVSADGRAVLPADDAIVAVVENGKTSYYELASIIENVVISCGRFMLDQSLLEEPPAAVAEALAKRGDPPLF
ncbi:MAG TPA: hypothetical protein VFH72_12900 [Candidatus Baltobacteraceae bacterium]|nr:hypothetical protein [Candidatus Baltobacteraceae bacterium]